MPRDHRTRHLERLRELIRIVDPKHAAEEAGRAAGSESDADDLTPAGHLTRLGLAEDIIAPATQTFGSGSCCG